MTRDFSTFIFVKVRGLRWTSDYNLRRLISRTIQIDLQIFNHMEMTQPYLFRTCFTPIQGIDEDLSRFIAQFELLKTVRFIHFCDLWRKEKFMHLIYGRGSQSNLCDVLGCIFHRLVDLVQSHNERSQLSRVAALYLLYAFHGKQPIKNQVRIRVCPESWPGLLQLASDARDEGHLDVYYIFRLMCAANAFHFCANRQVLYPSVPLFNSPRLPLHAPDDSMIDEESAVNPLESYLSSMKSRAPRGVDYVNTVKCLDNSVAQYADAKSLLAQHEGSEIGQASELGEDPGNASEDFLPGLNFVTYPDSVMKLTGIVNELDEQFSSIGRSPGKTRRHPVSPKNHSSGRDAVVSKNLQRLDLVNRQKQHKKRTVDTSLVSADPVAERSFDKDESDSLTDQPGSRVSTSKRITRSRSKGDSAALPSSQP